MNNQEYLTLTLSYLEKNFICESVVKANFNRDLQKDYKYYKKDFAEKLKKCKSPIEKLLCALLMQSEMIVFEPQVKIGKYTVDFLIDEPIEDENKHIVIECDGHEFHEKTKEQAKHDKERDRFLQKEGYPVYRFTGSEIFNNPLQVLSEIEEIVYKNIIVEED